MVEFKCFKLIKLGFWLIVYNKGKNSEKKASSPVKVETIFFLKWVILNPCLLSNFLAISISVQPKLKIMTEGNSKLHQSPFVLRQLIQMTGLTSSAVSFNASAIRWKAIKTGQMLKSSWYISEVESLIDIPRRYIPCLWVWRSSRTKLVLLCISINYLHILYVKSENTQKSKSNQIKIQKAQLYIFKRNLSRLSLSRGRRAFSLCNGLKIFTSSLTTKEENNLGRDSIKVPRPLHAR